MKLLYEDIHGNGNGSGSQFPSIFESWDQLNPKPDDDQAKQWICKLMEWRWYMRSTTTAAQMPASGAAWMNGNMVPNNPGRYLRYIKVKSREFRDPEDGEVKLQYHDESDEVLPPAPNQTTGTQSNTANNPSSINNMRAWAQVFDKQPHSSGITHGSNVGPNSSTCIPGDFNEYGPIKKKKMLDSHREKDSSDRAGVKLEDDINATNPTASTSTTATVDDGDDTTYYMYGTDFGGTSRSQTACALAVGTGLDDFVNLLHRCVIGLASAPPSVGTSTTPFGDHDEWYCWLQDSIQATQLTASAATGTTEDFIITMASPLDTVAQSAPATPNTPLIFNTHFAGSALDVPFPTTSTLGFVSDVGIMVFGLDKSSFPQTNPPTMLDMTLLQVFDYCGLSNMAGSLVMKFLGIINLQLDVANSEGKRNAVWFDPTANYRTVVRLQFDMPSTDLATFNGLFQDILPGLDLDSVTVIAKRTSFWALSCNGVLVQTEGDVTLIAQWTYQQITFDIAVEFREKLLKIEIKTEEPGNALGAIVTWLEGACTNSNLNLGFVSTWLANAAAEGSVPNLRRITLTIDISDTGAPTLTKFKMDIEVVLCFGTVSKSAAEENVVFLLSLDWVVGQPTDGVELKGTLWCGMYLFPRTKYYYPRCVRVSAPF